MEEVKFDTRGFLPAGQDSSRYVDFSSRLSPFLRVKGAITSRGTIADVLHRNIYDA